ncbi:MAG: hypothetical protein IKP88_06230 [Lachnospiraceae bacterium]|nr:hypothetical protein [Lachnospiraceae bacterium]
MEKILFIGFKGKNNSSAILVNSLSQENYLLTNSFSGVNRDIDSLPEEYDEVYLFGVDKYLTDSFRIELCAEKENVKLKSILDLTEIKEQLKAAGIKSTISGNATHYLCNEAYWYLLKKYHGRVALIHIPTIKHYIPLCNIKTQKS